MFASKSVRVSGGLAALLVGALAGPIWPCVASPEEAKSYLEDAKRQLSKGDLRAGEIQLRNAVRADPQDAGLHAQLAELYLKLANYPAAEAEAREAQRAHGKPSDVDPVLAEALAKQNKVTQLFSLVKPSDRDPVAESRVRLTLGLAHLQLRENKEASQLLKDAERLDDKALGPKIGMADLMLNEGDLSGADEELTRARAISPNDPNVLLLMGKILFSKGDTAGAISQYGAILEKTPNDVRALIDRGNVFIVENKFEEARKDINRASKISPTSIGANFLSALLAVKSGKLQQADDQLTKISQNFNYAPLGYYLLGAVQAALGQPAQAEANLSKYIARDPSNATARRILAKIAM